VALRECMAVRRFVAVRESSHDGIGELYMEGVILGFVSLNCDELNPIVYF